jgi:CIC family chloride channel protein
VVVLAAVVGVLTGGAVALFEFVTRRVVFEHLRRAPTVVQVFAPLVGLLVVAVLLRLVGPGATPSTADEYIKNFHDEGRRLDLRALPARVLASFLTLGLGGALGYEGPSIYLGAAIGSGIQQRLSRFFSREDAKVLLVSGAAAGVAAIFKAPATGLVFALEVPFQEDFARRMLLPAGIAAAVSYVAFVAFAGTDPLFSVSGSPPFDLRDLGGAALLGVTCGVGARLFALMLQRAKALSATTSPLTRALVAGAGLTALAAISFWAFGDGLTLGAGYDTLRWALDPHRAEWLVLLLFAMRAVATLLTVAGGGAGGLFIPLVIEGALLGRSLGGLFRTSVTGSNFFPLVGVSAFLGAGYRVPLAGVVFAAEATGRPGFIVPGLIAAVVAQLFMGSASVSPYQMATRGGHLERRFDLPLSAALRTDIPTAPPDTTLAEFFEHHLVGRRERAVPVVDGVRYVGVMRVDELREAPQEEWATTSVAQRMRTDFPTIATGASLRDALVAMEHADVDLLPVVDDGRFVGVVTTSEILRLDDILGITGDDDG